METTQQRRGVTSQQKEVYTQWFGATNQPQSPHSQKVDQIFQQLIDLVEREVDTSGFSPVEQQLYYHTFNEIANAQGSIQKLLNFKNQSMQ